MILVLHVKPKAWLLLNVMLWNYHILVTVGMRHIHWLGETGLCYVHPQVRMLKTKRGELSDMEKENLCEIQLSLCEV